MSSLKELISYAESEEKRKAKDELAKQLLPLWIARFAADIANGKEPEISFEELIESCADTGKKPDKVPKKVRSAEEIEAEFAPFIETDRSRRR